MLPLKRILFATTALVASVSLAAAQTTKPIVALPQIPNMSDGDLFIVEHIAGFPAGTSAITGANLANYINGKLNLSGQISTNLTTFQNLLNGETVRATAAEVANATAITGLTGSLNSEIARAQGAEGNALAAAAAAQATANAAFPASSAGTAATLPVGPGGVASYGDSRITGAAQITGPAYPAVKHSIGDAATKLQGGTGITVCARGDSLTYGQDTTSGSTQAPINGASQTRSVTPYPDALQTALNFAAPGLTTVVNQGYPGDTTIEGISRWATDTTACDVTIIMYGHNDANNYAGYAHGPVPVATYRANMRTIIERSIIAGSAVVVMLPPNVNTTATLNIRPYAAAAKEIAAEYGIPIYDVQEQLRWMGPAIWTDNVHLLPSAYQDLGYNLAALIARRGDIIYHAGAGTTLFPAHAAAYGGSQTGASGARGGTVLAVAPGQIVSIPVFADEDVYPVVTMLNNGSTLQSVTSYFDGGSAGIANIIAIDPGGATPRSSTTLSKLGRGWRMLTLRNDGTVTSYVESVAFVSASGRAQATPWQAVKRSALAGVTAPLAGYGSGWWAMADYGSRINGGTISANVTLDGAVPNGITLLADQVQNNAYLSQNQLMVLRKNGALIIRQFIAGSPTDTNFASVFAASGDVTGKLEITYAVSAVTVFWNGTQVGQVTTPNLSAGYPGLISQGAGDLTCLAMTVSE